MEIDYNEIKKNNFIIIDIRENNKYEKKHLPNSINVSFERLIIEPSKYLDKRKKYVFVCDLGLKSMKTSIILNNLGYHCYSLKGGIKKYEK